MDYKLVFLGYHSFRIKLPTDLAINNPPILNPKCHFNPKSQSKTIFSSTCTKFMYRNLTPLLDVPACLAASYNSCDTAALWFVHIHLGSCKNQWYEIKHVVSPKTSLYCVLVQLMSHKIVCDGRMLAKFCFWLKWCSSSTRAKSCEPSQGLLSCFCLPYEAIHSKVSISVLFLLLSICNWC